MSHPILSSSEGLKKTQMKNGAKKAPVPTCSSNCFSSNIQCFSAPRIQLHDAATLCAEKTLGHGVAQRWGRERGNVLEAWKDCFDPLIPTDFRHYTYHMKLVPQSDEAHVCEMADGHHCGMTQSATKSAWRLPKNREKAITTVYLIMNTHVRGAWESSRPELTTCRSGESFGGPLAAHCGTHRGTQRPKWHVMANVYKYRFIFTGSLHHRSSDINIHLTTWRVKIFDLPYISAAARSLWSDFGARLVPAVGHTMQVAYEAAQGRTHQNSRIQRFVGGGVCGFWGSCRLAKLFHLV